MMNAQMPSTPVTGRFVFSLTMTILRLTLSIVVSVDSVYSAGVPSLLGAQPSNSPCTISLWVTSPPAMMGQQVCRVSPRSAPAAVGSMTSVRDRSTISGSELILYRYQFDAVSM